ncbi:MAG: hypothetical protein ABI776_03305 [Nocardioidaceae bacterium]
MTTADSCSALHHARRTFAEFLGTAVVVLPDMPVEPPAGSAAQRILRFEIVHKDVGCPIAMADACVVLVAPDPAVRFVAPDASSRENYVSYWERAALKQTWQPMSDRSVTPAPEVCVVAQTLPAELGAGRGAGYLHVLPHRPDDGWTVTVGVRHKGGVAALTNLAITITVSARPDWTPRTPDLEIVVP